jgi:hypothetical protein
MSAKTRKVDHQSGPNHDELGITGDNAALREAIDSVVLPPKETKSDKFRRLAVNRVPRVVKLLGMLRNLANKAVYDYTDEQRDKVLAVVGESYRQFKAAFEQLEKKDTGFTL